MMKKIFALVFILVLGKMSYSQGYPISQNLGSDSTIVISKGALQSRLAPIVISDTTAANNQRIKNYPGAQLYTANGDFYVRNATATKWVLISSGSSGPINIYNSDGTLTGNRVLTGAGNSLTFNGISGLGVNKVADSVFTVEGGIHATGGLRLENLASSPGTKALRIDAQGVVSVADTSSAGAGFVPYVGATQNVNLGQFGLKTEYVEFDTTTRAVTDRTLSWSDADGTLNLGMTNGGSLTQKIGLQQFARVKNVDTVAISKGQAVYIFGASGDRASVKLATNKGDSTSSKVLGVAAENIPINDVGLVGTFGTISNLNLSAFTAGNILYLDSIPGKLTANKPQAPYHLVFVGVVERANAGNGLLFVNPQNGYELDELHNVRITSPVPNRAILTYDSVRSLWVDTTLNAIGGITGSGTSGQVAYFNGTNSITSSPTFAFTPTSQLLVNNSVTAASAIARGINATPTLTAAANNDVLVGLDIAPTFNIGAFTGYLQYGLRVRANINQVNQTDYIARFENTNSLYGNGIELIGAGDKAATRLLLRAANNDGTDVFRVRGNGSIAVGTGNNNNNGTVIDNNAIYLGGYQTIANSNSVGIVFSPFSAANAVTFRQTGNVLIGTTTDAGFRLDVNGTARVQSFTTINAAPAVNSDAALSVNATTNNSTSGQMYGIRSISTVAINTGNLTGIEATINNSTTAQNMSGFNSAVNVTANTTAQVRGYSVGSSVTGTGIVTNFIGYDFIDVFKSGSGAITRQIAYRIANLTAGSAANIGILFNNAGASTVNGTWDIYSQSGNASYLAGNLLLGTTSDIGGRLQVAGTITATSAIARGVNFTNTLVAAANNDVLVGLDVNPTFTNGAFTGVRNVALRVWSSIDMQGATIGNIGSGQTLLFAGAGTGEIRMTNGSGAGFFYTYYTNGAERLRLAATTGNLLLNTTTDAGFRLDVNGTARVQGNTTMAGTSNSSSGLFTIGGTGGNNQQLSLSAVTFGVGSNSQSIRIQTPTVNPSSGSSYYAGLDINGSIISASGTYSGSIFGIRNSPASIAIASGSYYGIYSTALTAATNVWNIFADGTAQNYFGGNVMIGTSTAGGRFTIQPTNDQVGMAISGSSLTGSNAQSLVSLSQTWNTTGNPTAFLLNITNTASGATADLMDLQVGGASRFEITAAGRARLGAYGSGTITGTATYNLAVDASGNVIEVTGGGGGGGIGGSGTTNYVPKFTASTTLGNSQIFDDGTNVGIGTATPVQKLEVSGSGNIAIRAVSSNNFPLFQLRDNRTPHEWNIENGRIAGALGFYYATGNATRMLITSAGNVGIQTTTVGSALQVNGGAAIGYSASTAAPTNGLAVAGNVGIGTNTPVTNLQVYRTTAGLSGMQVSNLTHGSTITDGMFVGVDDTQGYIYMYENLPIQLSTNSTVRLFINNDGTVFVGGTNAPASPTTGILSGSGATGTNIAGAELRIRGGASTGNAAGGPITFYTSTAGTTGSAANAATERMRLSAGNFLINQTTSLTGVTNSVELTGAGNTDATQQASYSVFANHGTFAANTGYFVFNKSRGTTAGSVTAVASGDRLGMIRWNGADGTAQIRAAEIYSEVDGTPGTNDMPGRIVFATTLDGASSPTERMRITNSGTIGVNTQTIGSTLQINGNAAIGYNASTAAPTNGLAVAGDILGAGNVRSSNGTVNMAISWQTGPTYGIVGTLSNHDVSVWTNGTQKMLVTTGGNVGINTASPTSLANYIALTINGTTGSFTEYQQGGANTFRIGAESIGGFIFTQLTNPIRFGTNNLERMTITSGGTVIVGNGETTGTPALGIISATGGTGTNIAGAEFRIRGGASTGNAAGGPITFYTSAAGSAGTGVNAATERMRIDALGNVGIGITPNSWNGAYKALQINSRAALSGDATQTVLSNNWFTNTAGNSTYIATAQATAFSQVSGEHRWFNAPSGTAGTTITFTQAMTLDASGNLGIGTNTIGSRLQVNGNAAIGYSASTAAPTNGLIVAGNAYFGGQIAALTDVMQLRGTSNVLIAMQSTVNTQFSGMNLYNETGTLAASFALGNSNTGSFSNNFFLGPRTASGNLLFVTGASGTTRMTMTTNGELQFTPAANTSVLSTTGAYSLTGANAQSLIDLAGTWNTTGNPTAIKLNITNTASGANSLLMDLQVGGTPEFRVTRTGNVVVNGSTSTYQMHVVGTGSLLALGEESFTTGRQMLFGIDGSGNGEIQSVQQGTSYRNLSINPLGGNVGIATSSPTSTLHANGSVAKAITTKTATYTLTSSDHTVIFNLNGNATANLPDATTCTGRIYMIKINRTNTTDTLTIDPNGTQTIDGFTTYALQCQYAVTIQSDGSNWQIVGDFGAGLNCL